MGNTSPRPGPRRSFRKDTYPTLKLSVDSLGGKLKAGFRSPILFAGLAAIFLVLALHLYQKAAKPKVLLLPLFWGQKAAAAELDQLHTEALRQAFEDTSGPQLEVWSEACPRGLWQAEMAKAQPWIVAGGILGPEKHRRLVLVAQSQNTPQRVNSLSMPIASHSLGEVFKRASRSLFEQNRGFSALPGKQTAKEQCQQQETIERELFWRLIRSYGQDSSVPRSVRESVLLKQKTIFKQHRNYLERLHAHLKVLESGREPSWGPLGFKLVAGAAVSVRCGRIDDLLEQREFCQVVLSDYALQQRPVRVEEYQECVLAGYCQPAGAHPDCPGQPLAGQAVDCLLQEQAQQYCAFLGFRLPSRAEWKWGLSRLVEEEGWNLPAVGKGSVWREWLRYRMEAHFSYALPRKHEFSVTGRIVSLAGAEFHSAKKPVPGVGFRCAVSW